MVDIISFLKTNSDWLTITAIIIVASILTIRYYTKYDKYEGEPIYRLLWALFLGIISIIPALLLSLFLSNYVPSAISSFTVAPVAEEFAKGLFVIWLARSDEFDGPLDGMVYGAMVGTGFAAGENALYALSSFYESGFTIALLTTSFRSIFQIVGHPLFTAVFGYGVGTTTAGFTKFKWRRYWQAVLFHAIWNLIASIGGWASLGGLIVVAFVLLYFGKRLLNKSQQLDKEAMEKGYYRNEDVEYA